MVTSAIIPNPFNRQMHEEDAPWNAAEVAMASTTHIPTWRDGMTAPLRHKGMGENSVIVTFILAIVLLLAFNIGHCRRLMSSFSQDLIGVRNRANRFETHTASETRVYLFIILLLCVSEGILIYAAATRQGIAVAADDIGPATLLLAALAAAYYIFQLAAYNVVGFAFADKFATTQWLRGFNASQTLLSMLLVFPAIVSLIYPSSISVVVPLSAVIYVVCRGLFITKGFRIFFDKIPSLLYFILYLCALEIVPLFIVGDLARGLLLNV